MRSNEELDEQRIVNAEIDLDIIQDIDIPTHPLTLKEIIELSLERNLDLRVKALDFAYQYELTTGAKLKMLPQIIAEGEISGRNRNTGSTYQSLIPPTPSIPPSVSSQENVCRYDLNFTWSLLDFGISYYRARQELYKTVTRKSEYERARHTLILDVMKSYWKARVSQKGIEGSKRIIEKIKTFKTILEKESVARILPLIESMKHQSDFLHAEIQLQLFQKDYHSAMSQLSQLMGLPPFCPLELADEEIKIEDINICDIDFLERKAIVNRPELYASDVEALQYIDDAHIALLQLFPDPTLFAGRYYDANQFLVWNNWLIAGLRYSWNLLSAPQHLQERIAAQVHLKGSEISRLALTIGVLTQVHIAYIIYKDTRQEFILNEQLKVVRAGLENAAYKIQKVGELSDIQVLEDYSFAALFAELDALKSFGEMQVAIEQINNSIGMPLYYGNTDIGLYFYDQALDTDDCNEENL
jgi:outer membrane protein TolC